MIFTKKQNVSLAEHEMYPIPIISDAAIATPKIGDGKLIPVLLLDTKDRQNLEKMVIAHKFLPPGDVKVWWGRAPKSTDDKVTLFLEFYRPAELTILIDFDILRQGVLIDLMLASKSFYLQPSRQGERFSTTLDNPRIIVEIPDTGFADIWNKMRRKAVIKDLKRKGLTRREAKVAADRLIEEWRKFSKLRTATS